MYHTQNPLSVVTRVPFCHEKETELHRQTVFFIAMRRNSTKWNRRQVHWGHFDEALVMDTAISAL